VRSGDVLKADFVEFLKLDTITRKIRPGSVTALSKKEPILRGRSTEKRTPILYGSEFALLQFIHGAGTAALGWCLPAEWRFSMVSMVSINLRIWFDGVETGDTGETVEPEEASKYAVFR
jgi:hypothetical protein